MTKPLRFGSISVMTSPATLPVNGRYDRGPELVSIGSTAVAPLPASDLGGDTALLAAVADLATSTTEELAERARAAIGTVLSHQALVIVAPEAESLPVRIAAPSELRRRLAAIDWISLVGETIPSEDGATRAIVPDAIAGLRPTGWVASSGGDTAGATRAR